MPSRTRFTLPILSRRVSAEGTLCAARQIIHKATRRSSSALAEGRKIEGDSDAIKGVHEGKDLKLEYESEAAVLRANQAASILCTGTLGQDSSFRGTLESIMVKKRARPSLLVMVEPLIRRPAAALARLDPIRGVLLDAEKFVANDGVRTLQSVEPQTKSAEDLKSALKEKRDEIAKRQQDDDAISPSESVSLVSTLIAKGLLEVSKSV